MSCKGISTFTYDSGMVHGRPKVMLKVLRDGDVSVIRDLKNHQKPYLSSNIQPNQVRFLISLSNGENRRFASGECRPS